MKVLNKNFKTIRGGNIIYGSNHVGVYAIIDGKVIYGITDKDCLQVIANGKLERIKYSGVVYFDKQEALKQLGEK